MKLRKILPICVILTLFICVSVFAASNKEDGKLVFGNVRYIQSGAVVDVEADVENKTTVGKNVMLIVASYDSNGNSYNIKINKQTVGAGESQTVKMTGYSPRTGCAVKAFVMENIFDNARIPMPAVKGASSTDLAYIAVNGKPIDGFSNDKLKYTVPNTDDFEIEAVAKDNTTAVKITKNESLNIYEITATASGGETKTFTVAAYGKAKDTTAISKIIYKADNETEEHEIAYTDVIELPENAKTVEIRAVAEYSESVSYYAVNNAISSPTDDVSYGTMGAQSRAAFIYERPMVNNTLPIKNEESKALIRVTGVGENNREVVKDYTVTFKARQPRLTSFVVEDKTYNPVFVSGAAIFDDNGSTCASDRNSIIKAMSQKLIGASAFLFPVNNKESNVWWHDNTSGTYFTFTAEKSGTVYVLSQSTINNSEYTEDSNNKKWKKSDVMAYKFEYPDNDTRIKNPDYILIPPEDGDKDPDQNYAAAMKSSYYRKFRAGETVEIYHTGNNAGVNDPKVFAAVVWNEEFETIASLEGVSTKLDKNTPLLEQIPTEVTATTDKDEKLLAEVEWDVDTYDKNKVGWQAVSGKLIVPDGYVLKSGISSDVTANVIVMQDSDYLSSLSYKIDGKEFDIPGFDPKKLSYEVELPNHTNTVEICATAGGTVENYVENNRTVFSTGSVSYGKMTSAAQNVFVKQRLAKNNIIPIKNEESTAIIRVKNTLDNREYEIEYRVVFKSRQIRLTSFETVEAKEILKPVFIGGAAVFDDGCFDEENGIPAAGSVAASDRAQILVGMPDLFKGASSFLFPVSNKETGVESDPETNNWWYKHKEGTYFSFSAEQGGTVYIYAQNAFKNSEYTEDSHGEGWVPISDLTLSLKNPTVTWNKGYMRTFKKGETVNIYHSGNGGSSSTNDYKLTGIVVWNIPIITSVESVLTADVNISKDIAEQLPGTVKVTMANGEEIYADVSWDLTGYENTVGQHIIKGKITDEFISGNEYTFADGVKNEITLTVTAAANKLKSVDAITPVEITKGEDISAALKKVKVTAKTIFGETVTCDVNWNTEGFDNTTAGLKQISGTLTPPDGIDVNGLTATVKIIVRYGDKDIVLALEKSGMDKGAGKWIDLSKYKNDITIPSNNANIVWDDNGICVNAGVDDTLEIPVSEKISDAILSHKFAIEFELASLTPESGGETPLITADIEYEGSNGVMQGKLIINYNDNKKRNDFKFGGNLTKYWSVTNISDIESPHINRVDVTADKVYWSIDGAAVEKSLNKVNITKITKLTLMGNSKITNSNPIGGYAVWKSLKIYKVTE